MFIYILELVEGKYYIGKTDNVSRRYEEHLEGKGSAWTQKYKPVRILKTIETDSPYEEDRYTKECMEKYGIDNVRGGTYIKMTLDPDQINNLTREIRLAQNRCLRCGKPGHFVLDCRETKDVDEKKLEPVKHKKPKQKCCSRCGRNTHNITKCYAKTHLDGTSLEESKLCSRCGRRGHLSEDCKCKTHISGTKL